MNTRGTVLHKIRRLRVLRGALHVLIVMVGLWSGALISPATAQTLVLEMEQGAFEDKRVRAAVTAAVNWRDLAEKTGPRLGAVVLRSGKRETALEPVRPDPQRVRRLLAEAGYGDNRPVQFFIFFEKPFEKTAAAAAEILREVGLVGKPQVITPRTRDRLIASTRYATGRQVIEVPYLILSWEPEAAPQPQRLADLVVRGRPAAGYDRENEALVVNAVITNLGTAPAGRHRLVFIDRSGTLKLPPVQIASLGPGDGQRLQTSVSVTREALGRELVLYAVVDSENAVPESDEGNNASEPLTYRLPERPRLPDLVVKGQPEVDFDPQSRELTLSVTVLNLGNAAAGPHRLSILEHSGTLGVPPQEIDTLAPRDGQSIKLAFKVPEETLGRELLLQAEVDPFDQVPEANEGNNIGEVLPYILPAARPVPRPVPRPIPKPEPTPEPPRLADLIVASLKADFDPQRQDLMLAVTVVNRGDKGSGAHRLALFDHSGRVDIPQVAMGPLGPRERKTVNRRIRVPDTALGETLVLQAEVDSEGDIVESAEDNNQGEVLRYPLPKPASPADRFVDPIPVPRSEALILADLAITAMSMDRDLAGQAVAVTLSVTNRGRTTSATTDLDLRAEQEGAWQRFAVPPLAPGAVWKVSWSVPLGGAVFAREFSIRALVDPEDRVPESEETNNSHRQSVTLPTPMTTWIFGAVLVAVVLSLALWRIRPRSRAEQPEPLSLKVGYKAKGDHGRQQVTSESGEPLLAMKIALRPVADPGTQTVSQTIQG